MAIISMSKKDCKRFKECKYRSKARKNCSDSCIGYRPPYVEKKLSKHDILVKKGASLLKRSGFLKPIGGYHYSCNPVKTEIKSMNVSIPDVIGWSQTASICIEAKASRSDFLADKRKCEHLGKYFYYITFDGIIRPEELSYQGLIFLKGRGYEVIKEAEQNPCYNIKSDLNILLKIIRTEESLVWEAMKVLANQ